jgi:hypothetical protein
VTSSLVIVTQGRLHEHAVLSHCAFERRLRHSDARRRKSRPATAAKSPGSSAETGSEARATWVCTTRSIPVT